MGDVASIRHLQLNPALSTLLLLMSFAICAPAAPHGLSVSAQGVLLKNGTPYVGLGVNYFDCFLRTLREGGDASYTNGFKALRKHGIPFARFAATGYWPSEMHLYMTNRDEYFRRMDGVIQSAQTNAVGLIPSLFWYYACVPDLVNESMDQWGNTNSRTHAFMRQYTTEIVSRYKDSPAIWVWEFGNEFNLACDLPNAPQHRPAVHTGLGTAPSRTERDDLAYAHLEIALKAFTQTIRRIDPYRAISAGNAILRPHAWHNMQEKTWKNDSYAQQTDMLRRVNPARVDLISVHCYGRDRDRLSAISQSAKDLKLPIFLGEFQIDNLDASNAEEQFKEYLGQIQRLHIPLTAIWVFDYAPHESEFNVSPTNSRHWELKVIGEWNARRMNR